MVEDQVDKQKIQKVFDEGKALLAPSVTCDEFIVGLGDWLGEIKSHDNPSRILSYQGTKEGGDLQQQPLQNRLGKRISDFLTQKLAAIEAGAGSAFEEQRVIDRLLRANEELGNEPVLPEVYQLGNAWLRCAQTRKYNNESPSGVVAAAKEAFLNGVVQHEYPVIEALLEGSGLIKKNEEYKEIFDSGLSSLKNGDVSARRVGVYCDQTLKAAQRARMDLKDAAGQIMGALLAGKIHLKEIGNRADELAYDREYRRMERTLEKPSGPSGGGGGGGTNYAGNLTPPKEARAGAGLQF